MEKSAVESLHKEIKNYSEESECVNMYLDDLKIPRKSEDGKEYSTVGRVKLLESSYLKQMSDVESQYLSKQEKSYSLDEIKLAMKKEKPKQLTRELSYEEREELYISKRLKEGRGILGCADTEQMIIYFDEEGIPRHEPKRETLEEFAEKEAIKQYLENTFGNIIVRKSIEKGAKWQQEQDKNKYSEEEFKEMVYHIVGVLAHANNMTFNGAILDELFNKFKKEIKL